MTASIVSERPLAAPSFGRFAGLTALVRKDVTEWIRGRRAWIVFAISALFMALSAANAWLITNIRDSLPPDMGPDALPVSLAPLDNLLAAVSAQVFVLAAVFAVASLIVRERESGTLAWVASKPVSRGSIWVSKWLSASGILVVSAVVAPIVVTTIAVTLLYGLPDPATVVIVTIGAAAAVAFYTTLGLAAGTVLPGQPAIVAVGFMVFALAPAVVALIPLPVEPYLPTSILAWSFGLASGADVGWVTPIAWAAWTGGLATLAIRRMGRLEL